MTSRRGHIQHGNQGHGRGHGFGHSHAHAYGHGHRSNGHVMHPELVPPSVGTGDGRSRKALLSFLLNDEDEGVMQPKEEPRDFASDLGSPMSAPVLSLREYGWRRPGQEQSFSAIRDTDMSPSVIGMPASSSNLRTSARAQQHQNGYSLQGQGLKQPPHLKMSDDPTAETGKLDGNGGNGEKRGVRKKRQRKFTCETCKFGFYTNSDLQKHVSSVHLLLRPYNCPMCDKKFGERSNATKHFKSVHERQKNASCDKCNKEFAFRDGLIRHIRLVHENVRNFHCKYPGCGQSFKQSAHLKKHEQVHTKGRSGSSAHHGRGGIVGAMRRPTASMAASAPGARSAMQGDSIHHMN